MAASWVWPDHEVIAFVEKDEYCQKVLKKHWPESTIIDDIHDVNGCEYADVDLLTGGFPCQPFSNAGKREGMSDDRYLWPEMLRVIRETRPRFVLGENVYGLVTWNEGLVFDTVLSDLEAAGYETLPLVIPACAVDAPHRRDRVWIIAHDDRTGRERPELPLSARRQDQAGSEPLGYGQAMAHAKGDGLEGWARKNGQSVGRSGSEGRMDTKREGEATANSHGTRREERHAAAVAARTRFDPRPSPKGWAQWSAEPAVGRVADGIPKRVDRLRALGNAIVPQVAAEIMMAMKSAEAA